MDTVFVKKETPHKVQWMNCVKFMDTFYVKKIFAQGNRVDTLSKKTSVWLWYLQHCTASHQEGQGCMRGSMDDFHKFNLGFVTCGRSCKKSENLHFVFRNLHRLLTKFQSPKFLKKTPKRPPPPQTSALFGLEKLFVEIANPPFVPLKNRLISGPFSRPDIKNMRKIFARQREKDFQRYSKPFSRVSAKELFRGCFPLWFF